MGPSSTSTVNIRQENDRATGKSQGGNPAANEAASRRPQSGPKPRTLLDYFVTALS